MPTPSPSPTAPTASGGSPSPSPEPSPDSSPPTASGGNNSTDQQNDDRNPAQDQKLTRGEIKKLKNGGVDPEELKGGVKTGQLDLFKDKKGEIYVKPKDGSGSGEDTGYNINDF